MIASVQYNDLRGTAAADVSDFYMNSLQNYLIEKILSSMILTGMFVRAVPFG